MSREQAETTLRQDIEYAWEPWLDKDTIPQSKFSRVIRNALAPSLIGQYKEAALVQLRRFIKESDIDEDELDELADSAMTKHSAWIAGLITDTTTKWIEDDENPGRAFSRERAELIAITEITRARTMGEMAAAELLAEVDVILVGTWITMEDELVCEICGPLHLTPESYWSEFFPQGSPAHVRCRCGIEWKEKAKRPSRRTKKVGRMGKRARPKKVFSRMRRMSAEEVDGFEVIVGTRLVEGGVGSGIKGHTTPRVRQWANTGAGFSKAQVSAAHRLLSEKLREISSAENSNIKTRQYLGKVSDFISGDLLSDKTKSTHVFWEPGLSDAARTNGIIVELGSGAFDNMGSSGSLGDTFAHEVEHLFDEHSGIKRNEFTPRFRQMMRTIYDDVKPMAFLNRHSGEQNALAHVRSFFDSHPGHELTSEQESQAVESVIKWAKKSLSRQMR